MIDFVVDKAKAIEALIYVASRKGQVTRFSAAKILYFADLEHLQNFGRPITGDYYVAMENGPVPSFVYDVLKGTSSPSDKALVETAIAPVDGANFPTVKALRDPDLVVFSKSDLNALDHAIEHVGARSFGSISDETHKHTGWKRAGLNAKMAFADMLDGADPAIVDEAAETSAYAVL